MTWRLRDTQSAGLPLDSGSSIHDETTNTPPDRALGAGWRGRCFNRQYWWGCARARGLIKAHPTDSSGAAITPTFI